MNARPQGGHRRPRIARLGDGPPEASKVQLLGKQDLFTAGATWVHFIAPRRDESEALHLRGPAPVKREIPLPETHGIRVVGVREFDRSLTERCEPFLLGDYLRQARNTTVQVWTVGEGFGIGSEFRQTGCAANNFRDHEVLFRWFKCFSSAWNQNHPHEAHDEICGLTSADSGLQVGLKIA